jgi:hypothetical protein
MKMNKAFYSVVSIIALLLGALPTFAFAQTDNSGSGSSDNSGSGNSGSTDNSGSSGYF